MTPRDADPAAAPGPGSPRPRSSRRRLLVLVVALLLGVALPELGLRWILFGESDLALELAERSNLRRAELFADQLFDDDYWKLRRLFLPTQEARFSAPQQYDPLLGWRTRRVLDDYDHKSHGPVLRKRPGRWRPRPLLLYGASYCVGDFDPTFTASDLSEKRLLLNYAVGGYGPDQAFLMLRESIGHYEAYDPVVVLGLEVNGDFDRLVLSFRDYPKPRGHVTPEGLLAFGAEPIPTVAEALARDPPRIGSYVLRALGELALTDEQRDARNRERTAVKSELVAALVRTIDAELQRRGLPYFYVLFNDQYDCATEGPSCWAEPFLVELFEREGIAYELTRPYVRRALETNHESLDTYFFSVDHPRGNHPTGRGIEVMLEAFRAGLAKVE